MRKSILAILAFSFISITHAAYILKIPLEQSQGGSLPDGSIKIPSKQTSKICQYLNDTTGGNNNTFWFSWTGAYVLLWDGATITDTGDSNDYFISNNWKYTKGDKQLMGSFGSINSVCREAL